MTDRGFSLDVRAGDTVLRALGLEAIPGVGHAFSTRRGSAQPESRTLRLRQIHGAGVIHATNATLGAAEPEGDAAVAFAETGRGVAVSVRTADCVPLLLADAGGTAVAAVHAGWRGIVAGVVPRTVAALVEGGCTAGALRAAIGPSIGGCCYEVGQEVLERVAAAIGVTGRSVAVGSGPLPRLDLRAAVRLQLCALGLAPQAVALAPWCTRCSPTLLFSYRRDGAGAGRQVAWIGYRAP